jgi:hypothetical protein
LANFHLDLDKGVSDRARLWFQRAEDAASDAPNLRFSFEYSNVRSQFALCEGNIDEARQYYYAKHPQMSKSRIGQRWINRLALRARQISGEVALSDIALDPMIVAATTLPRQEIADTEITIAVEALIARGFRDKANAVLKDYLDHTRLTRNPLDFGLAATASKI